TKREMTDAVNSTGFIQQRRYVLDQFRHHRHWQFYDSAPSTSFGLPAITDLIGISADIVLVPLPGHTWGQVGVAVKCGDRWLFHAGDAYFYRGEMDLNRKSCPLGLRLYARVFDVDHAARMDSQERL